MIAYFDTFSGISGDMALGALIDLGVPVDFLEKALSDLLNGFSIKTRTVYPSHLRAIDVCIEVTEKAGVSRNYTDIQAMIENSKLPRNVKKDSLTAFEKIAVAEAHIHGKPVDKVHFHEIGGIDAIVDIIGSFLCIHYLKIDTVYASHVPLGSGFVTCAHGTMPVPVPATLAILKEVPVTSSDATTEIVTPTGAAILTTLASEFGPMPQMQIKKTGYGAGKRQTGGKNPNLLRISMGAQMVAENEMKDHIFKETVYSVKTNVDDMTPEVCGFLMETLMENSALDVCHVPVQMKKNRPGIQIQVMCRKNNLESITKLILDQTTSIGVRFHECERHYLEREPVFVTSSFGKVRVKKITQPDGTARFIPEYEVIKRLSEKHNRPFKDVYNHIMSETHNRHIQ